MRQQTMYIRMKKAVMTIMTVALIFVGLWVPKQDVVAVSQEYAAGDLTVNQEIIADGVISGVNKIIIDGSEAAEISSPFTWTNTTSHSLYVIENSVSGLIRTITLKSINPVSTTTTNTTPQPTPPPNWVFTPDDKEGFGAKSIGTIMAPYFTVTGATLTGEYQGENWRNEFKNELLPQGGTLIATFSLKKDNGKTTDEAPIIVIKIDSAIAASGSVFTDYSKKDTPTDLALCYKIGDNTVVTPLTESTAIPFGDNDTLAIGIATIAGDVNQEGKVVSGYVNADQEQENIVLSGTGDLSTIINKETNNPNSGSAAITHIKLE